MALIGCSSGRKNTIDTGGYRTSKEMNLELFTDPVYQQVAVSEKGIYYSIANYLYFYDFETAQHVHLCNKPNCKHSEETDQLLGQECNAYNENASFGGILNPAPIVYHDGYLYMTQSVLDFQTGRTAGNDIVRINEDGSNRTSIIHSDEEFHLFFLHKDYLYFITSNILYRYAINENSEPEPLFENQLSSIGFQAFCVGDSLYLSVGVYKDKETSKEHYGAFLEVDLNSLEIEVVKEDEADLYFTYINEDLFAYTHNNDTYLFNRETREEKLLCDEAGQVHVTEKYIFVYNGPTKYMYSDGERTLTVFDKEFNKIDSIVLEEGIKHWDSGAFSNQLFVFYNNPEDYFSLERLYVIQVIDEKLKVQLFSEKYPSKNNIAGYQWNVNDYK